MRIRGISLSQHTRLDAVERLKGNDLARDDRGNILIMAAVALLPILFLISAGFDAARYYAAKSRLQQACDAGVMATRKMMVNGVLDDKAKAQGLAMFRTNYQNAMFADIGKPVFSVEKVPGNSFEVKGNASTRVPSTLAAIMGNAGVSLTASCNAIVELSNVDIMFVLDTTGSMNNVNPGDTVNKIEGLRTAVLNFFKTLTAAQSSVSRVRYGFVPYSSNVNVGWALKSASSKYLASTNTYQSRRLNNPNACVARDSRDRCTEWAPTYDYLPIQYKGLDKLFTKNGIYPVNIGHAGATVNVGPWNGCIEEVSTVAFAPGDPVPAAAKDIDINFVPDGANPDFQWAPQLPDMVFARSLTGIRNGNLQGSVTKDPVFNTPDAYLPYEELASYAACPTEAKRLKTMTSANEAEVRAYLAQLEPIGGTYHDIGMLWGARFISPGGIFAADNNIPGGQISRHIIFMTDGLMSPSDIVYGAYGTEALDQKIGAGKRDLTARHNARFLAACTAAKSVAGATVWVVSFGAESKLDANLLACASPNLAFQADNSAELDSQFKEIAQRISKLRLSQ